MKFELFMKGKVVGYEIHKPSSYYNKPQMRIFHGKLNDATVGMWDIKEWPERFIEHDKKRCLHDNTTSAAGLAQCLDCGYEVW